MEPTGGQCASPAARLYLRLQLTRNIGPIIVRRLLDRFGTVERILSASVAELADVEGVGSSRARAIQRAPDDGDVDRELALADQRQVRVLCLEDPDYPALLKHIPDPPLCLYVQGNLEPEDAVAVAIVGARRCTHYGTEQARRFASALAGVGFTVVSGLARGIDGRSHEGALAAGGRTLAVLGNGLSSIYPPEHAALADRVVQNGALISELPMEIVPEAGNFPRRNRIITGLCLGVLVIEASRRSGAQITARLASEYNREVFAVPGRVDSDASVGTNAMIRDGQAKLVTCLEDILDELGDVGRMVKPDADELEQGEPAEPGIPVPRLLPSEKLVYNAVGVEPTDLASICETCGLTVSQVTSTLTLLQMKGAVRQLPGNLYARRTRG